MKKIFGGLNITWPKLIIFAILMGIYTAVCAIVPALRYTSFITITATLEVWIFIGIIIIMNSKSNKDSALKCFVFFLISQPLVYLLQVPFSWQHWGLFRYYGLWFIWTILTLPMGYIGYYIKKDKWWGLFILIPMILITGYQYYTYLNEFMFNYPFYILIVLFCLAAMIIYPIVLFKNKVARYVCLSFSIILIGLFTVLDVMDPPYYKTQFLGTVNDKDITPEYKVSTKDNLGDIYITSVAKNEDGSDMYMVQGVFKRPGNTELTVETPEGEKIVYNLEVKRNTYKIERKGE